jgi:hypothetical protein
MVKRKYYTLKEWRIGRADIMKRYREKRKMEGRPIKPNPITSKERRKRYRLIAAEKAKEQREIIRNEFFNIYGNICRCCGETNRRFLTLDHINNDGYLSPHRQYEITKAIKFVDKTRYQTLCYNCNCGKRVNNGICPHKSVLTI